MFQVLISRWQEVQDLCFLNKPYEVTSGFLTVSLIPFRAEGNVTDLCSSTALYYLIISRYFAVCR